MNTKVQRILIVLGIMFLALIVHALLVDFVAVSGFLAFLGGLLWIANEYHRGAKWLFWF